MKLLVLLALLAPSAALADCPINRAGSGPYEWTNGNPTWDQTIVCGRVHVDLPNGILELAGGGGVGEVTCGAGLQAADVYQLVGPASAIAVAFTAKIHLSGNVPGRIVQDPYFGTMCYGATVASHVECGSVIDHFTDATPAACNDHVLATDRTLALAKLPGEAFTMTFGLQVGGHLASEIRQTLTFEGLPTGYTVQSCQGYGSAPTPASTTSWGSLKHTYR